MNPDNVRALSEREVRNLVRWLERKEAYYQRRAQEAPTPDSRVYFSGMNNATFIALSYLDSVLSKRGGK